MYSKFEGLDEEKRQRILNAAMKEFAAKGYDHASTNKIVEDAGIAKGLLFHYFKSKKQLFLYVYDYGIGFVTQQVTEKINMAERDFFVRLNEGQLVKFKIIRKYPALMDFLKEAYLEESPAVRQDLNERKENIILNSFTKAFDNIDTSVFRPDLDTNMVIKTVAWAYEGFANTYMTRLKHLDMDAPDLDQMFAEASQYAEFLKKCFYK